MTGVVRAPAVISRGVAICAASLWFAAGAVLAAAPEDAAPPAEGPPPGSITPDYPPLREVPRIDGRPLQEVVNAPAYLERLVTHLIGYETWVGICTDAEPLSRSRTWIVNDPVPLPGAETLEAPEWIEVVKVEGCGRTYERMVYATYVGAQFVFHVQLPGNTRTEPVLQHAAVTELRRRESEVAWREGCEQVDHARIVSGIVDEDWQGQAVGAWREVWTVHTCKGFKEVPVLFAPGEDGAVSFTWQDG